MGLLRVANGAVLLDHALHRGNELWVDTVLGKVVDPPSDGGVDGDLTTIDARGERCREHPLG
jgi:hypothetical protein